MEVAEKPLRRAGDFNKSRIYFLPMLEIPKKKLDPFLWECYIGDVNKPQLKERLFLLFDITRAPLSDFNRLYEELRHYEFYDQEYWLDEHKLIMIFFVPSHHLINYRILLDSKYSQTSDGFKNYLTIYHGYSNGSNLDGVLYRRAGYRRKMEKELDVIIDPDAELSSMIDPNFEYQQQIKNVDT